MKCSIRNNESGDGFARPRVSQLRRLDCQPPQFSSLGGRCERASCERPGSLWPDVVVASLPFGSSAWGDFQEKWLTPRLLSKVGAAFWMICAARVSSNKSSAFICTCCRWSYHHQGDQGHIRMWSLLSRSFQPLSGRSITTQVVSAASAARATTLKSTSIELSSSENCPYWLMRLSHGFSARVVA